MDAIAYSTVRKKLEATMERVCDDHEPIIVTRENARSVVIMSLEDYNAIEETKYLLGNSANAKNLRQSIRQYEEGKYKKRSLIEE